MRDEFNQDKSEKYGIYFIIIALLACILGTILYNDNGFKSIMIDPELSTKGTDVFLTYFFIIVAIERASAVYIRIYRNTGKKNYVKRIDRIKAILSLDTAAASYPLKLRASYVKEAELFQTFRQKDPTIHQPELPVDPAVSGTPLTNADDKKLVAYLQMILEGYEFKLEDYENGTGRRTSRIVFIGGILIAIMGISIFDDMLIISQSLKPTQQYFYKLIDIVVTGGLIGGGSQSFAMFISTTNSLLENAKNSKPS